MKVCGVCREGFESGEWVCPHCGFAPRQVDGFFALAPEAAESEGSFNKGTYASLADLEARNFWFRGRNRLIVWAMGRYFPEASKFLEIGCGTGFVLSGIATAHAGLRLCGSELVSAGLSFAAARVPTATLFQMDARNIPFEGEFDVIGAFDVLEHVREDETVLDEIRRAVVPGGGLLLTVPQHGFLWSQQDEFAGHVRRYSRKEVESKLRRAGFTPLRITSFVSTLLPLMFLSRLRHRKGATNFDAWGELRVGSRTNSVLEHLLNLECKLIAAGVSFPAGGSLLVAARRT